MSKRLQNQQILIEAVRSGDAAAFTQLVSLYQGPLRAFIAGRNGLIPPDTSMVDVYCLSLKCPVVLDHYK